MCACVRECVFERERDTQTAKGRTCSTTSHSTGTHVAARNAHPHASKVCARERERDIAKEERACVCVCVCERERERENV